MKKVFELENQSEKNYTLPELKKQTSRWFIEFYFNNIRYRNTYNLNRVKNLKEREELGLRIRNDLQFRLINGWNPEEIKDHQEPLFMTFEKGLEFAFKKKIKNKRLQTLRSNNSYYNRIINSIEFNNFRKIPIKEVTKRNIIDFTEQLSERYNLTNNVHNYFIRFFKHSFNILLEYEEIDYNVTAAIKFKEVEKNEVSILSDIEVVKIKNHLIAKMPNYWDYIFFLFQTGLRPNEITAIKIKMINMSDRIIVIPKEYVKTKKERIIVIDNFVYDWLLKKDLQNQNMEHYLFGFTTPISNKRRIKDYEVTIAPHRTSRELMTNMWKKLVKRELGISSNLYSIKHLRANKELIVNENLELARVLFGHADLKMTEVYATQKDSISRERLKASTLNLNNLSSTQVKTVD